MPADIPLELAWLRKIQSRCGKYFMLTASAFARKRQLPVATGNDFRLCSSYRLFSKTTIHSEIKGLGFSVNLAEIDFMVIAPTNQNRLTLRHISHFEKITKFANWSNACFLGIPLKQNLWHGDCSCSIPWANYGPFPSHLSVVSKDLAHPALINRRLVSSGRLFYKVISFSHVLIYVLPCPKAAFYVLIKPTYSNKLSRGQGLLMWRL